MTNAAISICYFGGFRKKLEALPKQKECGLVGHWQRSIINHLYWCIASSTSDSEMVKAKWLSLEHHVHNVHSGHGEPFPKCAHGELESCSKKWFKRPNVL